MKQKFLLVAALLISSIALAETSLVVYPLSEAEQATVLSSIGYVKLKDGQIFIYSKENVLIGYNQLSEVRKVTYEDRCITPTDLEVNTPSSSVLVYPNPTQDALVIKNADADVARIFNMSGQLLITAPLYDGCATLNVSSFSQGTYLLQLNTELVKFIKQ